MQVRFFFVPLCGRVRSFLLLIVCPSRVVFCFKTSTTPGCTCTDGMCRYESQSRSETRAIGIVKRLVLVVQPFAGTTWSSAPCVVVRHLSPGALLSIVHLCIIRAGNREDFFLLQKSLSPSLNIIYIYRMVV